MEATLGRTHASRRQPLGGLGRLNLAMIIGIACLLVYVQVVFIGRFQPDLILFAVLSLAVAGLVATGWRWTPLLGALWSLVVLAGNSQPISYDLTHPVEVATHNYAFMTVSLIVGIVGLTSGLGAGMQNYRHTARTTPRWISAALASLVCLALGGILVAAIAHRAAAAGVDPAVLEQLPAISASGLTFDQKEIQAHVGETIALRLDNTSSAPHSFDVDELNVHVPMLQGKSGLALFRPEAPGSYTFYCSLPGHREAGMVGTLVVTP